MKPQPSTGWPPWPLSLVATVQICLCVNWRMFYAARLPGEQHTEKSVEGSEG